MRGMRTDLIPEWTLADRLEKARRRTRLSRQELADRLYVSKQTIINYESDDYPSRRQERTLRDWARECGVSLEWLKNGDLDLREGPSRWMDLDLQVCAA